MNSPQQLQHLYWRAGFGPRPQDVAAGLSPRKALRQLLHDSAAYEPLVGAGLNYTDPQGAVMAEPAAMKNNPVPNGMVTTPDQPAAPGAPAVAVAPMRPRTTFKTGVAAGVLNHPANGVAWLANRLAPHGEQLNPGDVVLAGSFTRPTPAVQGDSIHTDYGPLGSIAFRFV